MKIRDEVQEYPNKSLGEAFMEKLAGVSTAEVRGGKPTS
jgi:hypothetical protein